MAKSTMKTMDWTIISKNKIRFGPFLGTDYKYKQGGPPGTNDSMEIHTLRGRLQTAALHASKQLVSMLMYPALREAGFR